MAVLSASTANFTIMSAVTALLVMAISITLCSPSASPMKVGSRVKVNSGEAWVSRTLIVIGSPTTELPTIALATMTSSLSSFASLAVVKVNSALPSPMSMIAFPSSSASWPSAGSTEAPEAL